MARVINQEYRERVPLDEVRPHPQNPNQGDVEAIAESIEENGFYGVVVVQASTKYIVAGEHRWRAARKEDLDAIPMVFADIDDATALRMLAGDNRLGDLREYNRDRLAALLTEMAQEAEHGLKGTGYTEQDMTDLLEQMAQEVLGQGGEGEPYGMPGNGLGSGDGDLFAPTAPTPIPGDPSQVPSLGAPGSALTPSQQSDARRGNLADQFIVPPFSVLDARQGYWQERKRAWLALGIRSELGRGETLLSLSEQSSTENLNYYRNRNKAAPGLGIGVAAGYGGMNNLMLDPAQRASAKPVDTASYKAQARLNALQKTGDSKAVGPRPGGGDASGPGREAGDYSGGDAWLQGAPQSGTSIFDPVLCELAYRWFSPAGGVVLDPFAGGSVRGIVASKLGRVYHGVELRGEQVAANREQAATILRKGATMAAPVATATSEPLPSDLVSFMAAMSPIRPEHLATITSYMQGFALTRKYPRHYLAPLRLAAGANDFLWRVVGGCLCVVKRKWVLGNPVLYLIVPPIHPQGDTAREREVLEALRALGVGARLSSEDLALYGYREGEQVERDGENAEYIYRAGDFTDAAMAVPERKRDRYYWRLLLRLLASHEVSLQQFAGDTTPDQGDLAACEQVNRAWHKHKGKAVGREAARYLSEYPAFAAASPYTDLLHVLRDRTGKPIAYTIGEQVGDTWAVLGVRYHDYAADDLLKDSGRMLHTLDARAWVDHIGPDALLNLGASVGIAGLAAAKGKLAPVGTLQLYRLTTPVKLTAEMWKAAAPQPEQAAAAVAALSATPPAPVPANAPICDGEGGETVEAEPGQYTPVEHHGGYLVKRDDLYRVAGVAGGKVRSCWHLAQGAAGLITAGSRHSPQVNIVAHIAASLGIPCRVHVPSGELSPEVLAAQAMGAEVVQHKPGYNSVIVARARTDAQASGWREIPFGMECAEAVEQTAGQVESLRDHDVKRIVMPVGSGMSLAGVLHGLQRAGLRIPVLGVRVGADPTKRLDKYAPEGWRDMATLVDSPLDYSQHAPTTQLGDLALDPVYESKCLPYLEEGDLLWVVGIRQTAQGEQVEASAPPTVAMVAASKPDPVPTWYEGDSRNIPTLLPEGLQADLVFTCPPYYDLEVYSDDPADLSAAATYADFLAGYRDIIRAAVERLKPNRFAACVVGDIRGPQGYYCNFVSDTIAAFEAAGARLYNEAILVTAVGSLPVRSGRIFNASRKLGKSHQNVLVFCKGDPAQATAACGEVEVALPEGMAAGDQGDDTTPEVA